MTYTEAEVNAACKAFLKSDDWESRWQPYRVLHFKFDMRAALTAAAKIRANSEGDGEVRGPCIPVTYCGLATSTHVPLGSDEDHCDLCGHPAQPYAQAAPAPENEADGLRETMWAEVIYEGEDNSFRFELNEEGNRDGPHYDRSIEFAADTFPAGTKIIVYEPDEESALASIPATGGEKE